MKKTDLEILGILNSIKYHDYWFVLLPKGDGFLLQLRYLEPDIDTGKMEVQHARKWYISPHATESEIVRTAFLACMTSAEHRVREHFLYRGKRIFGPHISVQHLLDMDREAWEDHRDPQPKVDPHQMTAEELRKADELRRPPLPIHSCFD